ncbi:PHOMO B domain-containing protein [Mycena sanguinolenta]|uniref:PHOMO B domain-containing protein n=1 Tax=Mycena sanguinolenta TaxID=230812 RepID=A0A8H6YSH7_9AGAR|nr:PHOMO B domain-containing protein [Mycena sanguinolenta]
MRGPYIALFSLLHLVSASGKRNYETHNYYVVEHDVRHATLAAVSRALGVEVVDRAGELPNHWLVRAPKFSGQFAARDEQERDPVLDSYERLRARTQAAALAARDGTNEARTGAAIKYLSRQTLRQRAKRAPLPQLAESQEDARAVALRLGISDPLFPDQWHLINDQAPEHSMNVVPVWEMGYTGRGVISTFVDDGLDYTSEDLMENFDADDSYDFNDHESLPYPKLSDDTHGTRCAGQVAAGKNGVCGLGIAYESKVAGVRILSGAITDIDEAAALNYGFQNVSIYSCSWGPPDTGTVMEGPDYLINKAVLNGINAGRGGKGSIFVFASGNGAGSGDQCNFDGYTNSIYSVTVSAVDHTGQRPYYSEACTANMVAAYSSGSKKQPLTRGRNKCTSAHGGTSAAAPNAVGVFALAVEARPDLTWRDIQHLCVETARMINPEDEDWDTTAAGRKYSSKYGYGVLDGLRFVQAAKEWELVKPQARMQTRTIQIEGGTMKPMGNYSGGEPIGPEGVSNVLLVTSEQLQDANFEKLEHIVVRVWIDHSRRGDVVVELTSPAGIKSVLAEKRRGDSAKTGFPGWTFMTIKHWGEDVVGDWTLRVSDQASATHSGSFLGWDMVFWGSVVDSAKAVLYEITHEDPVLPPHDEPQQPQPRPSTTKSYVKPTVYLTTEDGSTTTTSAAVQPTSSTNVNEDVEGSATLDVLPTASKEPSQISIIMDGLTHKLWTYIFLLILASLVGGIVLWRCRVRALHRTPYMSLPGDGLGNGVSMGERGGRRSTDSDDADERTGLNSGSYRHVGFHSGFLDDDEDEHEYPPSRPRSPRP